jgi:Tol biopolymer transport system component
VFARQSTLFAVPFAIDRLSTTGTPIPVLDNVGAQTALGGSGSALYDVSSNGTLAYLPTAAAVEAVNLVTVDRNGSPKAVSAESGNFTSPRYSPDGSRIAVFLSSAGAPPDIWVYDVARGAGRRVTFSTAAESHPVWTPDGRRITYTSRSELFMVPADGSGQPEQLLASPNPKRPGSWSPDGAILAFGEQTNDMGIDLWVLHVDRGNRPEVFLRTPANEATPEFSPDGRWLAYQSDETGINEVYVRRFPDSGGKWQITTAGGMTPRWRRDGRELFFRGLDGRVMSVAMPPNLGNSFEYDTPKQVFAPVYAVRDQQPMFDVTPNGTQFVMVQDRAANEGTTHVMLIFNWFEDVKRRLSAP